jgi:hypothetical protein
MGLHHGVRFVLNIVFLPLYYKVLAVLIALSPGFTLLKDHLK